MGLLPKKFELPKTWRGCSPAAPPPTRTPMYCSDVVNQFVQPKVSQRIQYYTVLKSTPGSSKFYSKQQGLGVGSVKCKILKHEIPCNAYSWFQTRGSSDSLPLHTNSRLRQAVHWSHANTAVRGPRGWGGGVSQHDPGGDGHCAFYLIIIIIIIIIINSQF